MKQDGVDIKPVTLQDLTIEVKMVKQEIKEIKEDNSTKIEKQNIAEIVNLKDFPKPLTDSPVIDIIITDLPILLHIKRLLHILIVIKLTIIDRIL